MTFTQEKVWVGGYRHSSMCVQAVDHSDKLDAFTHPGSFPPIHPCWHIWLRFGELGMSPFYKPYTGMQFDYRIDCKVLLLVYKSPNGSEQRYSCIWLLMLTEQKVRTLFSLASSHFIVLKLHLTNNLIEMLWNDLTTDIHTRRPRNMTHGSSSVRRNGPVSLLNIVQV